MEKFIIIGAGILGATVAYQLAKSGNEVIVIDRNKPGQATDAAAGIICPWISQRRNKAWYHLAKNGAKIYPSLIEELKQDGETDTGYARVGAISIRKEHEKLIEMKERAFKRLEDAPEIGEVTVLTHQEAKTLFPPLADGFGAVHISGAARVDGRQLRNALIRGAKKHGATFIEGKASLFVEGKTIVGASVQGTHYKADTVIATCGAWMKELFKPLGVHFNAFPQKGQLVHIQMPNTDTSTWPLVMPPSNQSIVPFENHMIIGATHESSDIGFDTRVTAGGLYEILTEALKFAPGLEDSSIIETRVGIRPYTPGFLPVIGSLPTFKGLLLANGLGASGLTTGPFVGIQLAKMALGEELSIDLKDYDVAIALT